MSLREIRWLIPFMWFAYLLNYGDRQVMSSIFPVLRRDLHFTELQLGLSGAVFLWSYGLISPIAGQLGDRFSKRALVIISLVLWSLATTFTGLANSPAAILWLRAMTGVTEALFLPAAIAILANTQSPQRRSFSISIFLSAQQVGSVLGGWYGGRMVEKFSWRLAFFLLGGVGLIYAVPYALVLRMAAREPLQMASPSNRLAILDLMKVPSFVALCICFPPYTGLLWVLYMWLPDFIYSRFSLSLSQAGFVATVYLQSAILVGLIAGGGLGDRLQIWSRASRFWVVCGSMLFTAPCVYLLGHANTLLISEIAMVGTGLGFGLFMANFIACPFDVVPAHTRASAIGVMNLVGTPVSGLAVLFGGVARRMFGIGGAMSAAALISLLASLALMIAVKRYFAHDHARNCSPADWAPA